MIKAILGRRIVSVFLCLCFFDPSGILLSLADEASHQRHFHQNFPLLEDFERLSRWVSVQEYSEPTQFNGKFLFILRDLHGDQDAQLNIAKIIETISRETPDRRQARVLVLAEGAEGPVDTSFFGTFPDETIRRDLTKDFVGKGWITGPEYLSIARFGEVPIEIFGVEDPKLYTKNFREFRDVLIEADEMGDWFEIAYEVMKEFKKRFYHKELFDLDDKIQKRRSGKIDHETYAEYLLNKIRNHEFSSPNLMLFSQILKKKKVMDEKKLTGEREELLQVLGETLEKEALSRLIRKSLEFRLGKIHAAAYFEYLAQEAWKKGVDLNQAYPHLSNGVDLFALEGKIDASRLIEEMENVEEGLFRSWLLSPQEQLIYSLSRQVEVLEKMCQLQMSREDLALYEKAPTEFSPQGIIERLEAMAQSSDFILPTSLKRTSSMEMLDHVLEKAGDFYKTARLRDKAITEHAIRQMEAKGVDQAVLIAGGFHTQGIVEVLKSKGWGYAVGVPRLNHAPNEEIYLSLMMDERFESHALALPSFFSEMINALGRLVKEKEWEGLARAYVRAMIDTISDEKSGLRRGLHQGVDEDLKTALARYLSLWKVRRGVLSFFEVKIFALLGDEIKRGIPSTRTSTLTRPDIERFVGLSQVHAELTIQILERFYPDRKEDLAFAKAEYKRLYLQKKRVPQRKMVLDVRMAVLAVASLGASVACDVVGVLSVDPFPPSIADSLPGTVSKKPSHIHYINGDPQNPLYIFDDHNEGNYKFTPEELQFIYRMVDSIAPTGSRLPKWVATSKYTDPFYGIHFAGALATPLGGIVFPTFPNSSSLGETLAWREGDKHFDFVHGEYLTTREDRQVMTTAASQWLTFPRFMLHEMHHQIHYGWSPEEVKEWVALNREAMDDKRPEARDKNFTRPYAWKNWWEDAASTGEDFIETPKYLGELIHRAEIGFPALLRRALFQLSFLTVSRPDGQYVNFYNYYTRLDAASQSIPVLDFLPQRIFRTKDSLVLPGVKFALERRGEEVVIVSAEYIGREEIKDASGSVTATQEKHFKNDFPRPVVLPRTFLRKVPESHELLIPEAIKNPTSSWATPSAPATPSVIDIIMPRATPDVTIRVGTLDKPVREEIPFPGLMALGLMGWGNRSKGKNHPYSLVIALLSVLAVGGCGLIPYSFFVPPLQKQQEFSFVEQLPDGVSKVPSYVYHPNGKGDKSIYIFDTHAGQDLKFTPEEVQTIFKLLDSFEKTGVRLPKWIATAKIDDRIYGLGRGGGFSIGDGIVFPAYPNNGSGAPRFVFNTHELDQATGQYRVMTTAATIWKAFPNYLMHELGYQIQGGLSKEEVAQWDRLYAAGRLAPEGEYRESSFVSGKSEGISDVEEFATAVGFLVNTQPYLYEAIQRSGRGYSSLLQKVLFAMSLFIQQGSEGASVDFYYYDSPYDGVVEKDVRLIISPAKIVRTPTTLTMSGFEFTLEKRGGKTMIVGVKSLDKFKGSSVVERDFRDRPIEVPQVFLRKVKEQEGSRTTSGSRIALASGSFVRDDARLPRKPKWDRGTGLRVEQRHRKAHDGFIKSKEGDEAEKEFESKKAEIQQFEIIGAYEKPLAKALERLSDLGELQDREKGQLMAISEKLNRKELKFFGFQGIVKGREDFFLGHFDEVENKVYLALDLIHRLGGISSTLVQEYLLHEILCPILGHERAILVQQKVFPENYPDEGQLREQNDAKPYKGLLGAALRRFINKEARKEVHPRQTVHPPLGVVHLQDLERGAEDEREEMVLAALHAAGGNPTLAAQWLGIDKRGTLYRRLSNLPPRVALAALYQNPPQNTPALKLAQVLLMTRGDLVRAAEVLSISLDAVMSILRHWTSRRPEDAIEAEEKRLLELHTGRRGISTAPTNYGYALFNGLVQLGRIYDGEFKVRIFPDPIDGESVIGVLRVGQETLLTLKSRKDGGVEPYRLTEDAWKDMTFKGGIDWDWLEEKFDLKKIDQVLREGNGFEKLRALRRIYESYLDQLGITQEEEQELRRRLVVASVENVKRHHTPGEVIDIYLGELKLEKGDLNFKLKRQLITASYSVAGKGAIASLRRAIHLLRDLTDDHVMAFARRDWITATYMIAKTQKENVLADILSKFGETMAYYRGQAEVLGDMLGCLAYLTLLLVEEREEEVEELESYFQGAPTQQDVAYYFKLYRTDLAYRVMHPQSRGDGFIKSKEGKKAQREFGRKKHEIEKNDVGNLFRLRLDFLIKDALGTHLTSEERQKLSDFHEDLRDGKVKIYGFEGIVKGKEDFFLGHARYSWFRRKGKIYLATDLIKELEAHKTRVNKDSAVTTLADDYLLHEILCPLLGHERAIRIQQQVFREHYPDISEITGQLGRERSYRGLLQPEIRGYIDRKSRARNDTGNKAAWASLLGAWLVAGCTFPPFFPPWTEPTPEPEAEEQIAPVGDAMAFEGLPEGVNKIPTQVYYVNGKKDKPIYIFDHWPNENLRLTPEELATLFRLLDILEPIGLQLPKWFATMPKGIKEDWVAGKAYPHGGVVFVVNPNITPGQYQIQSVDDLRFDFHGEDEQSFKILRTLFGDRFAGGALHEIGHVFLFNLPGELRAAWGALHEEGTSDPREDAASYNFVESQSLNTKFGKDIKPYGSKNKDEDLGSIMGNVAQTQVLLLEAIGRAQQGYPNLLRKVLFILSLLTRDFEDRQEITFFELSMKDDKPVLEVSTGEVKFDGKSLSFPGFEFVLTPKAGQFTITSAKFKFKDGKEFVIDFTIPIPIPDEVFLKIKAKARSSTKDGYIANGPESAAEFEKEKAEISKNDITPLYWGRLIDLLNLALKEGKLSEHERRKIEKRLESFRQGKENIYGFKGIVKGEEDFFLGHYDLQDEDFPRLFLSQDLMEYLKTRGPPTLEDEYLMHELLCPILGHKRAMHVQQRAFRKHYPDKKKLAQQTAENPYKGILRVALREYIGWEVVNQLEDVPKRFFEDIYTSTPWPILWRYQKPVLWEQFFDRLPVTLGQIVEAFQILRRFGIKRTPLIPLPDLSEKIGMKVLLKDEGRQITGSFKPRILASFFKPLIHWWGRLLFAFRTQVITTGTTGNQGQGVAWAAKYLQERYPFLLGILIAWIRGGRLLIEGFRFKRIGLAVKVFTAFDTPDLKEKRMRALGAEVVRVEGLYEDARTRAEEEGKKSGVLYLAHAGEQAVASYGSLGLEIVEDLIERWKNGNLLPKDFSYEEFLRLKAKSEEKKISKRDSKRLMIMVRSLKILETVAVLVPIGAGGVAAGVLRALKFLNPFVTVVGVASDRTQSMYVSLRSGELTSTPIQQNILEDGTNVDQPEPFALEIFQQLADGVVIVPHEKIEEGIRAHYREAGIKSEGAAVLPYLALSEYPDLVEKLKTQGVKEVVLVSTGRNIDRKDWLDIVRGGVEEEGWGGFGEGGRGSDLSRSRLPLEEVFESPIIEALESQRRRIEAEGAKSVGYGPRMNKMLFTLPGTPAKYNLIDLWHQALEEVFGNQAFLIHPKNSLLSLREPGILRWKWVEDADFVFHLSQEALQEPGVLLKLEAAFQRLASKAGISVQLSPASSERAGFMRLLTVSGTDIILRYTLIPFEKSLDPTQMTVEQGAFNLLGTYFGNEAGGEWVKKLKIQYPHFANVLSHFMGLTGELDELFNGMSQSLNQLGPPQKIGSDYQRLIIQAYLLKVYRPLLELAYMMGDEVQHKRLMQQLEVSLTLGEVNKGKILDEVRKEVEFFTNYPHRSVAQRMIVHYELMGRSSEFDERIAEVVFSEDMPNYEEVQNILRLRKQFPFAVWLFWQQYFEPTPWWMRGLRPLVLHPIHAVVKDIYLGERHKDFSYEQAYIIPIARALGQLTSQDKALLFGYFLGLEPLPDGTFVAVGRYRFEDLIGVGTYGIVFKVTDLETGRVLAVKLIPQERTQEKAVADQLLTLFRQGEGNSYVMEIVKTGEVRGKDGLTRNYILSELIETFEVIHAGPERKGLEEYPYDALSHFRVAMQVLEALGFLLGQGILVTDPKVAITGADENLRGKLFDFGYTESLTLSTASPNGLKGALQDRATYVRRFQQEWIQWYLMVMDLVGTKLQSRDAVYFPVGVLLHQLDLLTSQWTEQERVLLEPMSYLMRVGLYYLKGELKQARRYLRLFETGPVFKGTSKKARIYTQYPALNILRRYISGRGSHVPADWGEETQAASEDDEWMEFLKGLPQRGIPEGVRAIDLATADGAFKEHLDRMLHQAGKNGVVIALGPESEHTKVDYSIPIEVVVFDPDFGPGSFDLVFINGFQAQGLLSEERSIHVDSSQTDPDGKDTLSEGRSTREILERHLQIAKLLVRPGGHIVITLVQGQDSREILAKMKRLLAYPLNGVYFSPVLDLPEKPLSYAPSPFASHLGRVMVLKREVVDFKSVRGNASKIAKSIVGGLETPERLNHSDLIKGLAGLMRDLYPDLGMSINDAFRQQVIYEIASLLTGPNGERTILESNQWKRFAAVMEESGIPEKIVNVLGQFQTSAIFLNIVDKVMNSLGLYENPELELLLLEAYTRIYVRHRVREAEADNVEETLENILDRNFEGFKKRFQKQFGIPFSPSEALVQFAIAQFTKVNIDFFNPPIGMYFEGPFMVEEWGNLFIDAWEVKNISQRLQDIAQKLRTLFPDSKSQLEMDLEKELLRLLPFPANRRTVSIAGARQRKLDQAA